MRAGQVFELETDPDERKNLANEPSMAATVAELRERTRRQRTTWSDAYDPASPHAPA
jgi:hypothetical protein